MVPILLVLGDVQLKVDDERAVKTFGLSIGMQMGGRPGGFLHPKKRAKRGGEFSYWPGPIVEQQLVWYARWNSTMVKKYLRYM